VSLKLNKGLTLLKFFVKKGGFNLNWFKVSLVYEIVDDTTPNRNYLYQNYPNPFYRESRLKYELKDECQVKLSIIDMSGKEVAVLVNEVQPSDTYTVDFDVNKYGLLSGTYLCVLKAGNETMTEKMVVK
jgi:hypothetical protein